MAPEQLEGKEADARSDIFAFGATVYEMVTGTRAFSGTNQASLVGSILKDDPPPLTRLLSRWQVSSGGGIHPLWRRDGQELLYLAPGSRVMGVAVQSGSAPVLGNPQFVARFLDDLPPNALSGRSYDISPDGRRFLMIRQAMRADDALSDLTRYEVVRNWFEELKARVPSN